MNEQSFVVDVTEANIQEVLQQSADQPVLLYIGMQSDPACSAQLGVLEALAAAYQGKLILAKVAAETEQMLAQQLVSQLQVRALPGQVVLHQGRPVKVFSGPQSEEQLREVLDPLTMSPAEMIRQQVEALMAEGEAGRALELLQNILQDEPDNHALQVLQVNLLLELGRIDEARQLMAVLPADAEGIAQPKAKLAFYEMVADAPARNELAARLVDNDNDHEARYQLAIRLVIADQNEEALENLLTIVRRDREFRKDGARLLMLQVFDQLGQGNPIAKRYRGKLFGLMH
ncbi:tetratricopeptide repeat protein [Endozoicomonas sp. GU-1]|uniref:tetratricopeptide repeat protein n=1 Tax=Endozoicomonas sp. GU-1 TaxID=3009078 RepID=UPI0022B3DD26|nr:tetratricopeptide repeat protein [Endozoicomonas sp. GU-1]WBA80133.1 tetratricopeptide repeat protein [Endozoicomonas sp. GU-1]WBA87707.1 tetratricopeptide repeat protein [Endozoicomonas sp. GU-1]